MAAATGGGEGATESGGGKGGNSLGQIRDLRYGTKESGIFLILGILPKKKSAKKGESLHIKIIRPLTLKVWQKSPSKAFGIICE